MKHKPTIKDLETATGAPDSIRKVSGANARSDMKVSTLQKQAVKLATKLVQPVPMPESMTLHYADGSTRQVAGDPLKAVAAYLNALESL